MRVTPGQPVGQLARARRDSEEKCLPLVYSMHSALEAGGNTGFPECVSCSDFGSGYGGFRFPKNGYFFARRFGARTRRLSPLSATVSPKFHCRIGACGLCWRSWLVGLMRWRCGDDEPFNSARDCGSDLRTDPMVAAGVAAKDAASAGGVTQQADGLWALIARATRATTKRSCESPHTFAPMTARGLEMSG